MAHIKTLSIKKHTLTKTIGLLFAIAYGFIIVASVQRHLLTGSGDIASYVFFFDDFESWTNFNVSSLEGEGIFRDTQQGLFRFAIFELRDLLNQSTLAVLSYIAFLTSSIFFYIFSINIKSKKYFFNLLPLLFMVFFTPRVMDLFASSIRAGISFTILVVTILYLNGVKKHIFFGLSILIHLSMLPIISLYYLYYILGEKKINSSFILSLFILLLYSFLVAIAGNEFHRPTGVSSGIYYNILVLYLGLLIIFTNKRAVKDIYGFISIGFILIVLSGFIIDFSFIRYVRNAIIIYLFFIINKGGTKTIEVFTIGYAPFFILTFLYSITNHW